jgi:hypothetical protein
MGLVGMILIGAIRNSMGHVGVTVIGAFRSSLRKLAAVTTSSPQTPHGIFRWALHLKRLLVETVLAG